MAAPDQAEWDYVIVGSGAGGGTLAARLAESGMRVFLLEAGSDPETTRGPRLPDDYDVPGFHRHAARNAALRWTFPVRHAAAGPHDAQAGRTSESPYPRAATLGGCTAVGAMIFMQPHDADWDEIARATGDTSWRATNMRRYVRRVEDCRHAPVRRRLGRVGLARTGHGWDGWLPTEKAVALQSLGDRDLATVVRSATQTFVGTLRDPWRSIIEWSRGARDPDAASRTGRSFSGLCRLTLTTDGHRRVGTRERLLRTVARHPKNLHIEYDALATRVLFDAENVAIGVAYLKGKAQYRAHATPSPMVGSPRMVLAKREVVLCGGAFNTPQLLMLSGIGEAAHLQAHRIGLRVDLPGVGRNLQDRCTVAVTHRMRGPWRLLAGARFAMGDPPWRLWDRSGEGPYASNGAALALIRRSRPTAPEPDLLFTAMPARVEGYRADPDDRSRDAQDVLTWTVSKAHAAPGAGTVRLRSADPRDPPAIDFRFFDEAGDPQRADLAAMVSAIRFVRHLTAPLRRRGLIVEELGPGETVRSDAELAAHVRDHAWGEQASCSCPIGAVEAGGVVDGAFRVHGVKGLRIVDASVFPRIPGFHIAAAVYMIGEKAADAILHDAATLKRVNTFGRADDAFDDDW